MHLSCGDDERNSYLSCDYSKGNLLRERSALQLLVSCSWLREDSVYGGCVWKSDCGNYVKSQPYSSLSHVQGRGGRGSVRGELMLLLLCLLVLWLLLWWWWWLQKTQQTSCISSRVAAICHQLLLLIHQGVGGRGAWQDMARHTCFTVPSLVCKIIIIHGVTDVWSGMT